MREKVISLKEIVQEFFELENVSQYCPTIKNNTAVLSSYLWNSKLCSKIRLCNFEVKDKFYAESLVIYPDVTYETPIFGTEYLRIGNKKYFGVIDFHPITEDDRYLNFMEMFTDRTINKTSFYELNRFFSKKLWISKRKQDFYNEYQIMVKCFLHQYRKCLESYTKSNRSFKDKHIQYNEYMSTNDPAFGILKSYFGKEFAEEYIHNFLFSNK